MRPNGRCCANLHLVPRDHLVAEVLLLSYPRDVDDFAAFADTEAELVAARARIAVFLERRRLRLHPRKTMILRRAGDLLRRGAGAGVAAPAGSERRAAPRPDAR